MKQYKITSVFLELSMDQTVIERQTYSLLEWLGDCGGLYDALKIISGAMLAPLSSLALNTKLLTQIFRTTKKNVSAPEKKCDQEYEEVKVEQQDQTFVEQVRVHDKLSQQMQSDFEQSSIIPKSNYLKTLLGCSRKDRYKKMLARA